MKKPPPSITLSAEEGEALIERVEGSGLRAEDRRVVVQVIRLYFWLMVALQEAKLSLKRFRTMLFGEPANARAPAVPVGAPSGAEVLKQPAASSGQGAPATPSRGGHRPGQGRLGAEAYGGAERVECRHEELAVGDRCPVCGQGRFYALPPGVEIRIDGNALLAAIRYELEKLRGSACGEVFTAKLPAGASEEKYSPRARAVLAVSRYYLGLPLYRLEAYQAMVGVPVADATQWDQIERVADCAYVVFAHLEVLAAQGEVIYQDDTTVRILSLIAENRQAQAHAAARGVSRSEERTGMYTTALVVKVGEQIICLYYSGRAHAGENLKAL